MTSYFFRAATVRERNYKREIRSSKFEEDVVPWSVDLLLCISVGLFRRAVHRLDRDDMQEITLNGPIRHFVVAGGDADVKRTSRDPRKILVPHDVRLAVGELQPKRLEGKAVESFD